MRVLVNARFLLKGKLEGIGLYTHEVLSRVTRDFPEHEFIFAFDRPFSQDFIYQSNVTPTVLTPPARHPFLFYIWFEHCIPKAYRRYSCDLFFSPDGFTSLSKKVNDIITIHDLAYVHYPEQVGWLMRKYYQFFMPRFIAKAGKILTVSESSSLDITSHFPSANDRVTWIHNGVNHKFQHLTPEDSIKVRGQWSQGKPYFVVLGAMHPRKNLTRTVKAFDVFKKKSGGPEKLFIIGRSGWQTAETDQAIKTSPFATDIVRTGYLDDEDLNRILSSALGLLYVSLFEGFGLPLVQAMARGVPVITSNRSSMPEVVQEAGLKVDPEDVEAIASAMQSISKDPALRTERIQRGLDRSKEFSWDKTAAQVARSLFDD